MSTFFQSNSTPQNPYRHTAGFQPNVRSSGGSKSKGKGTSMRTLQRRALVFIATCACFMVFLVYRGTSGTAGGGAGADTDNASPPKFAPRLKGGRAAVAKAVPPVHLNIMTFNIRFAGGNDGYNGWDFRKDHVASIINRYHPAIMGTQEGLKDQLQELEALLEHPYESYGVEREENGEFEKIFYDTSLVERLDGGNFWLSETPDTKFTKGWDAACVRLVTWCKFRILATKQDVFVFNTQLDHVGPESRAHGRRLLWDRIQRITKDPDAPLFLMGDFNTYRHLSTYEYFTELPGGPHFQEAWPQSEKQVGTVAYTYHAWNGPNREEERTAKPGEMHIDWIFYRPTMRVLSTEVITEQRDGRFPSDHYPIQAEFVFPSVLDVPPSK